MTEPLHSTLIVTKKFCFPRHAVDWIQAENKLRVLVGKCGKIMFTLNIPSNYPYSREITLDTACGLEDLTENNVQVRDTLTIPSD